MSNSQKKIWYNNSLHQAGDINLLTNRAFRYGDGLIETIRLMNGELLFFYDHMERMFSGMQSLMMNKLQHWDANYFYDCISRVLIANDIGSSARIRIQVWREGDGLYVSNNSTCEFMIEANALDGNYVFNENGLVGDVSKSIRKTYDRLANIKTSSALTYVMAAMEAKEKNVDVMFVLNERNGIADAPGRNVFIIDKGRVLTPSLQDAGVAGVFRHQLLELLRSHKIQTEEKTISIERLQQADEIFVTNVIEGIQPVTTFQDKNYKSTQTKELYQLFMNHLKHIDGN